MNETKEIHTLFFSNVEVDNPHDSFEVMNRERLKIPELGIQGTFTIIGSSHYIEFDDIDYQELFSYRKEHHSGDQNRTQIEASINQGSREYAETTDGYKIHTNIDCQKIQKFDPSKQFDVYYKFGRSAYTTISVDSKSYYSYHTYPERDVAVHTQTTFEPEI